MTKALSPKSILVVLDESRAVIETAVALARAHGARLTALFVLDTGWNQFTGSDWLSGSGSRADYLDYARDHEFLERDRVVAALGEIAGDLPVDLKIPAGLVLDEILAELGNGYDLVVAGNPVARGLEKYRDAPARMAAKAPCSILFVKAGPDASPAPKA